MRSSIVIAPLVAAIVGYGSTIALIFSAAKAVGATPEQAASWAGALCLATAAATLYLTLRHRMPLVAAWSTPGAALIAATSGVTMSEAVGAFLFAAALILLTAALRPLGRLIERLPASIAAGMLAGILLRFVIDVFVQAGQSPALVLPLVGIFLLLRLWNPAWAIIAVLVGGVALAWGLGDGALAFSLQITTPVWITPAFDPAVLIGLGLPLYLVTMAGQNLPGYAVLRTDGYQPPTGSILTTTGIVSAVTAPFGGHTTNMAAITAAICTGPDVHPDKNKRWMTGPFYALNYALLGVFGASFIGFFAGLPPALIATVAGLALAAPLTSAAGTALADDRDRFAAMMTLVVTASGLALFGIGSAFWGLCVGLIVMGLDRARAK